MTCARLLSNIQFFGLSYTWPDLPTSPISPVMDIEENSFLGVKYWFKKHERYKNFKTLTLKLVTEENKSHKNNT